jgi:two-component system, LuxR family, response regulator FixJ
MLVGVESGKGGSAPRPMADPVIHIVDDDELVLKTLTILFRSVNLAVRTHRTAAEFLAAYRDDAPGCLVLDIRMPEMSGLQLLQELRGRGHDLPVIGMSGHADMETAVKAMQLGAVNFLSKPFKQQELLDEVTRCVARHKAAWDARQIDEDTRACLDSLTVREREILGHLVKGESSKGIGAALGISHRTVEAHRRSMLAKFRVHSAFELAQKLKGPVI